MTIHDSLMKKEAKNLLALARQRSLTKVGDIGRISREIESGQASEAEIWELIKDLPEAVQLAGGRPPESKEVDAKMLEEIDNRLEKLEAFYKKSRKDGNEMSALADRIEKTLAEHESRFEARMQEFAAPAPDRDPAPARIDEDELRRIVESMVESMRERTEGELENVGRRLEDRLEESLGEKLRRIEETAASVPQPPLDIEPVFAKGGYRTAEPSSEGSEDLAQRISAIEERLSHRPRVSVFTSRDPRFGEVSDTVRTYLLGKGAPGSSKEIVDHIVETHPGVVINPKDIGNRLTNMGLARVRPRGSVQGKSSTWWIAGHELPEGYVA